MTDMTINERLAVLEVKVEQQADDAIERKAVQQQTRDELAALKESITELNHTLTKYHGFVGGVLFIASAIGIFFYRFLAPIWDMLSGKTHG